jgi:hypothetical protein
MDAACDPVLQLITASNAITTGIIARTNVVFIEIRRLIFGRFSART